MSVYGQNKQPYTLGGAASIYCGNQRIATLEDPGTDPALSSLGYPTGNPLTVSNTFVAYQHFAVGGELRGNNLGELALLELAQYLSTHHPSVQKIVLSMHKKALSTDNPITLRNARVKLLLRLGIPHKDIHAQPTGALPGQWRVAAIWPSSLWNLKRLPQLREQHAATTIPEQRRPPTSCWSLLKQNLFS